MIFQVWELDRNGDIKEKLGGFDSVWPGLLRTPDAGFTWTNGLTYLFQGERERETERQRERDREREREGKRQREGDRQRDRETERQRDRETERQNQ